MAKLVDDGAVMPVRFFGRYVGPQVTTALLEEVITGLDQLVNRARYSMELKSIAPKGSRQPPEYSHVMNWLLAAILEMPMDQQEKLVRLGKASCDERQRSPAPVYFTPGVSIVAEVAADPAAIDGPPNGQSGHGAWSTSTEVKKKPRRGVKGKNTAKNRSKTPPGLS